MCLAISNKEGFTLVEVMITLLVLAVGLLGLAGLQAQGLSGNSDSSIKSQATLYVYDMVERMRTNRAGAIANTEPYEIAFGAVPDAGLPAVIRADLNGWLAEVGTLPQGEGMIALNNTANGMEAIVTVRWSEKGTPMTVSVNTML